MTLCRNKHLSYESFATYGAVATLGKTGVYTVGLDCRIGNRGVSKCINRSGNSAKLFATYGTVNYGVIATGVYTVGIYVVLNNFLALGMTGCGNNGVNSAKLCLTHGTVNYGVITAINGTLRCYVVLNNFLAIGVTVCGNSFLSIKNSTTYGAVATLSKTGFGTSGSLSRISHRSVTNLNGCGKHLRNSIYRIEFCVCHFKLGNGNGIFAGGGACRNLNCNLCNVIGFYG